MSDANRSVFSSDVPDSRRTAPPVPLERPVVTGSGEQLGAHWTLTRQDFVGAPEQAEIDAYGPVVTELMRARPKNWLGLTDRNYVGQPKSSRPYAYDRIWADVAERRAADPTFMKDVPAKNEAEFTAWVKQQEASRRRSAQGVLGRESGFGQKAVGFGADIVSSFADPINLATLPIGGGGKTIVQAAAREALLNTGVELLELPTIASNRKAFGEDFTAGDAAAQLGVAALGGAAFGGGAKGLGATGKAAIDSAAGRAAIAAIPGMSPDRRAARALLRDTTALGRASDAEVAQAFARAVPADARTPDQAAALHVVERQGEIDATNPFVRDRAGMAEHADRLTAAMDALADGAEAPPAATPIAAAPDVPRTVSRETPQVGAGAREQLKARIGRVENATGNPNARNPMSSATGKYQFVDGTWLRYYKKEIGGGGLSDAAILARRSDGATQDRLMDALLRDNAAGLHAAGEAETAGNLYLAHFAGIGGAKKILKAAPDTPIERVLTAEAIVANPFLRGKSAGDVIAWAHRKMGEAAVPPGERARIAVAGGGDDVELRLAQQALDASAMERATLAASRDAAPGRIAIDDADEAAPWTDAPVDAAPVSRETSAMAAGVPRERITMPDRAVDPDVVAAVRAYVSYTREAIKPAAVASRLGIDEVDALAALRAVAARTDAGLIERRPGAFSRPREAAPRDLLRFIAERGGIRDDAGHELVKGRGLPRIAPSGGVLIRRNGMSVDEARELAAEAEFFHDLGPEEAWSNTTEDDFLQMLEAAVDTPHYARGDLEVAAERQARRERSEAFAEARSWIDARLTEHGFDLTEVARLRAAEMVASAEHEPDQAIARLVNEEMQDALDAAHIEGADQRYADLADDIEATLAESAGGPAAGVDGQPVARGRASDGGAGVEEWRGADADARAEEGLDGPAPPDAGRAFDDPDGQDAVALADSLAHDVRAEIDPNIAARQAQEAALGAKGPLRAKVDQESTIGSPLFDAVDQGAFRLDEEGGERAAADILAEIDADEAAIATARNCL